MKEETELALKKVLEIANSSNDIDVFIPVPLHKKRLIFRRYNQALFLAEEIAKLSNKTIIKDFLQRNEYTPPQSKLKRNERIVNLKNNFKINEKYLKAIDNYKNLNIRTVCFLEILLYFLNY